jgi:hypothetical protein
MATVHDAFRFRSGALFIFSDRPRAVPQMKTDKEDVSVRFQGLVFYLCFICVHLWP